MPEQDRQAEMLAEVLRLPRWPIGDPVPWVLSLLSRELQVQLAGIVLERERAMLTAQRAMIDAQISANERIAKTLTR
ncbi:MAG TPA: hypothetical protein VFG07_07235 [Thermoplasmata archaeon]|nr:hypothetical protein [Thermoplasmata archaeon]